jgi:nucleoside-diphosphate-sugar epimerase
METKRKVLLTGSAGRIGTYYRGHAGDRYNFRLVDVKPTENPGPHEALVLDLADPDATRAACEGIDTVLHLAADPRTSAEFYQDLLGPNFKATYNIYRAAKDAGCARVIFASSINAVGGYSRERQVRTEDAPCPSNVYGASKAFGESLGAYFASCEGLSVIAVRIGGVGWPEGIQQKPAGFWHEIYCSYADLSRLFDRCIETPDISFAVVHGVSNNRHNHLDLTSTKALLGYEPQDDAFAIADGAQTPPDTEAPWRQRW